VEAVEAVKVRRTSSGRAVVASDDDKTRRMRGKEVAMSSSVDHEEAHDSLCR
jgi:hypothetical protein